MPPPGEDVRWRCAIAAAFLVLCAPGSGGDAFAQIPPVDFAIQGFSMRMRLSNVGSFGHVACPPFNPGGAGSCAAESLGLEYPVGQAIEHIYGGGIWVGGLLDTTGSSHSTPMRLVSVTYEGAGGPDFEFYPGASPADTFWSASRSDQAAPPGWSDYWGSSLPYRPISDQDLACAYTDNAVRVSGHVPLGLKVIQSSYAWNDPYADAILIFEYRIMNIGRFRIDSTYVGYSVDADVGPSHATLYYQRNFTAYIAPARTAYVFNPVDAGSTPVGFSLLSTSKPLDSLRYTFQWFPLGMTPPTDAEKYVMMSSGTIRPDEYPALSDTRFLFAFGPFTLFPAGPDRDPDTVKIAVAVVSGYSTRIDHRLVLQRNTARALDIYLNQGIRLPATPPSPPLRVQVGFRRVELDWRWREGDRERYGRPDPEQNWDSTNQQARHYPYRITHAPPGFDSTRGGRNFSAFRLWRSENPHFPENSFVLLKQYDDPLDSFEYNTGLQYSYVDSNLVRGKTYVYAVTSKSIPNIAYQEIPSGDSVVPVAVPIDPLESSRLVNALRVDLPFSVSTVPGTVRVVPNPYRTDREYSLENGGYEGPSGEWDENSRKIKFINLPEVCTIRVFSLAGELIRSMEHDGRDGSGFSRGDHDMFLLSESNRALASGIYIFQVESALGTQMGKFVVIR
jgi:hypothetical protein